MRERIRKRVETVTDAADYLGVSRQRLQQFQKESPWWEDWFRSGEGFDVVAIALAQAEWHWSQASGREATATTTAEEQQIAAAAVTEAVESAKIKSLERQKRERIEAIEGGRLVAVEIAAGLISEALAELRVQIEDLPYRFSRQVPDELKSLVFLDGDSGEVALLQRMVKGVVDGFAAYLDLISDEMFDRERREAEGV